VVVLVQVDVVLEQLVAEAVLEVIEHQVLVLVQHKGQH
jgi:hypothetical protein